MTEAFFDPAAYMSGFGNQFETEALAGSLPVGRNSPQRCAHGLYAEQISGSAFTAPRHSNRRTWLYRIRPALAHGRFEPLATGAAQAGPGALTNDFGAVLPSPNPLRWSPWPLPAQGVAVDFLDGLTTLAGTGNPDAQTGCAIHLYACNRSMQGRYFYNADGELLVVPQLGRLRIRTELGVLAIEPQQVAVIPRGIRFCVDLPDGLARGYVCENFGVPLRLPDLGPIGANGLAQPRDFFTPVAAYEDVAGDFELVAKLSGALWRAPIAHSPLDVVAWHGNHAPYQYDLRRFNTLGSISFDHPDPSIFLVLHSPSDTPGVSNLDFVIFPPRILAMRDTFRPPWFHRNIASEFMGLIHGEYDAKGEGFLPGGASLHNCMTGHGPDAQTFERASQADTTVPQVIEHSMAFMFETRCVLRPTARALQASALQADYAACWAGLPKLFGRGPGEAP